MGATAEDLIYSVINWVQTFILTLSGGLLQKLRRGETKGCGLMRSSKRIQGFFVKEPNVLLGSGGTTWVHVSTANSQGKNKVIVERNQLWLFCRGAQCPPGLCWNYPPYPSHLQGSHHISSCFPCASCTECSLLHITLGWTVGYLLLRHCSTLWMQTAKHWMWTGLNFHWLKRLHSIALKQHRVTSCSVYFAILSKSVHKLHFLSKMHFEYYKASDLFLFLCAFINILASTGKNIMFNLTWTELTLNWWNGSDNVECYRDQFNHVRAEMIRLDWQ